MTKTFNPNFDELNENLQTSHTHNANSLTEQLTLHPFF
jgi:hypothetical protein